MSDLAAANARIAELEAERDEEHTAIRQLEMANNRLTALQEACLEKDDDIIRLMQERNAANARVAAANALLQEVWDNGDIPRKIGLRIQRHLADTSTP